MRGYMHYLVTITPKKKYKGMLLTFVYAVTAMTKAEALRKADAILACQLDPREYNKPVAEPLLFDKEYRI